MKNGKSFSGIPSERGWETLDENKNSAGPEIYASYASKGSIVLLVPSPCYVPVKVQRNVEREARVRRICRSIINRQRNTKQRRMAVDWISVRQSGGRASLSAAAQRDTGNRPEVMDRGGGG